MFGIPTKSSSGELLPKIKAKLEERARPSSKSWDEKKKILTGCWLIEERDGDFWCDCYEGIRGRMCEHTPGMHFRQNTGRIPVTEDVRSLPISQKRPRGRPKQLPKSCLTKSPAKAAAQAPAHLDVSTEVLEFAPGDAAPAREVPQLLPCTSCQEAGKQAVAVVYCATCTDHMCQECNAAHSKLRITKIMSLLRL